MKVRVTQIRSRIDSKPKAKRTLDALGLRRNYRSVVHEDTPQLRGMLRQIAHLVRVEPEKEQR
ncbi:MAG: 50S ribosomal protein L30 [Gammaproteobacteria bacterium]|nr:50S ribosomal protein L30 [Gammaproteobacteria bacterium]